jgi:hypothetical protein
MATLVARAGVAFDDRGTGRLIVLLLGQSSGGTDRRPIVDRPAVRVRTLAIDPPGHGDRR